jgi:hypothetical protein
VSPSYFGQLDDCYPPNEQPRNPFDDRLPAPRDPSIIDRLAQDCETTTTVVPSLPGIRMLVAAGFLVPDRSVYTTLAADGAVELIYLDIDQ